MSRLEERFRTLAEKKRAALIAYLCAGAPDYRTSLELLRRLPGAGADIIELGMPFSDPMADGPTVQAAARRALRNGHTMARTLAMVSDLRSGDKTTPLVLMGYYNPIHRYGPTAFARDAAAVGVDGLLIVDLPSEHREPLGEAARAAGMDMIPMATPATNDARAPAVLTNAGGFLYYVSLKGVTGVGAADHQAVRPAVQRLRGHTSLPVCVGFGVRTEAQAAALARDADGVAVGSALVECLAQASNAAQGIDKTLALTQRLASAVREARR